MTTLNLTQVRDHLPETVNRVAYQGERVTILRHNHEMAALVSMHDLHLLERMEDQTLGDEALRRLADPNDRLIPWEKAKRRWRASAKVAAKTATMVKTVRKRSLHAVGAPKAGA